MGAALLLAAPLILVERLMNERIDKDEDRGSSVADDVHRTQTKIDQLGQETRSRIAAARRGDTELLNRLRADASERNVWSALHRAQEFAGLDHEGVRVRIRDSSLRVRFNATPGDVLSATGPVEISVEDRDGRPVSCSTWSSDESAQDALATLAEDLQRHHEYPGDERLEPRRSSKASRPRSAP